MAEQENEQLKITRKKKNGTKSTVLPEPKCLSSKTSKLCILPQQSNIDKLIACSVVVVIFTTI